MALRNGIVRRPRRIVALVCIALAGSVVAVSRPAAAAVAGDLAITKAGFPASATAGNRVLYRITVSNLGTSRSFRAITVTDSVAPGTTYDDGLSSSWCGPSGGAVTCVIPGQVGPGQTRSFDVVVSTTPTTPTFACGAGACIANTAEITASTPLDPFPANNRSTAQTALSTAAERSAGFLPGGASAAASSRSGRAGVYALTAPASSNGVVFDVSAVDPLPTCGTECLYEDAVVVDFEQSLGDRQVTDPANPLVLQIRMGPRSPCRGIGGDDPCFNLRYAKPGVAGALVPFCDGAGPGSSRGPGVASPSPCKNHQFKTPTGEINFEVRLLSRDPIFY